MLAVQRSDSPRKVFLYLYTVSDEHGLFELDATQVAQQTGLSRKTVYKAIAFLQRVRVLFLREARTGRGQHSLYQLNWRKERSSQIAESSLQKKCHLLVKKKIYKTQTKDATVSGRSGKQSLRRETESYQGPGAARVTLIVGARFYRHIMRSVRLGLEDWTLPEPICHALEGFFGTRIDGASLAYARELRGRIWTLRSEIEALARSGASPRGVCAFVAGWLAGIPDRARREVSRRTAKLMSLPHSAFRTVEQLERRIAGLRAWLRERGEDYRAGQVCRRCGYRHSEAEYRSGRRAEGAGLNCFGYARVKLEELLEQAKLARRRESCHACGGSLADGHVEGLCWSCWKQQRSYSGPVLISELLNKVGLNYPSVPSSSLHVLDSLS